MVRHVSTIAAVIFVLIGAAMTGGVRAHASDPSIYVVTNTNNSGPGSLRDALTAGNSDGTPSTIVFNIPTSDPGFNGQWFTISAHPLKPGESSVFTPQTEGMMTIDGTTQAAFTGHTNPLGPEIFLDLSDPGAYTPFPPLSFPSDGNIIRGLVVGGGGAGGGAGGVAIALWGSNNVLESDYVGTDPTGRSAFANGVGVLVNTKPPVAPGFPIGGSGPNASGNLIRGNVISANGIGIRIENAANTAIEGNFIGTDATGKAPLGNTNAGIAIVDASSNVIGGLTGSARNVISANGTPGGPSPWIGQGVVISGAGATGNVIQGNYIGTDVTGSVALGNRAQGISVGAPGNLIGGTVAGARNIISANGRGSPPTSGLAIQGGPGSPATDNVVQGNYIGTDATGTVALGNGRGGVTVNFASRNTIGGAAPGAPNIISGNGSDGSRNVAGIAIAGPVGDPFGDTIDNVVQGNYIGTDPAGTNAILNASNGVSITGGASANVIGGTGAGEGNLISGNSGSGVFVSAPSFAPSTANVVQGNLIGTDRSGTSALANAMDGIALDGDGVAGTIIGGTTPGSSNIISGNAGHGVAISRASDTVVQGNFIGTNAAGTAAIPNGTPTPANLFPMGVWLNGTRSLIGGTTAAARNIISGNSLAGVFFGASAIGNSVQGNYIGTDVTGSAAIPNDGGITFKVQSFGQPTDNVVGGNAPGAGNLISGNRTSGIVLAGTRNLIEGNRIGTDAAGSGSLANGGPGVVVGFACQPPPGSAPAVECPGNVIGAATPTGGNTIAFNRGPGIAHGTGFDAIRITRNSIFANAGLGIDLGAAGVTPNDPGDTDTGPNGLQNFPVIGTTEVSGGSVTVTGGLDTQSPATATVEVFGNDAADPSGYGEGQRYVASVTPAANGCFSVTFPASLADHFFTSTATDASGDTSEFSRAIAQGATKAAIALAPATATNVVGTTHTVTATLTNTADGPVPCAVITFTISGANTASGTGTTDINGTSSFTYTGVWAGEDTITATSGPATGTATKTWTFPASTAGRVSGGGQVPTLTSTASFGLTATGSTGDLEFNEKSGRNVHSTRIAATVISGMHATVYGFATVNGAGDVQFRVDTDDVGEPGTNDVFRVVMRDGYTAGGVLQNGNIQIQ